MDDGAEKTGQERFDCPERTADSGRAKILKTTIFVIVVLAVCALAASSFLAGNGSCSIPCGTKSVLKPCSAAAPNAEISTCPLKQQSCIKDKTCEKKSCCPLANKADNCPLANPGTSVSGCCPKTSAEQ